MHRTTLPRPAALTRTLPLILFVLAPAAAPAQQPLPDAQQIVARYIEAIGGEAALREHSYRHDKVTLEMPAQGVSATIEVYAAAPNRIVTHTDIPGMGVARSGFDGEVAWSIHPATGPMLLEGNAFEQQRQQADFYGPLNRDRYVQSMETVERIEFEGRPCYRVKVVTTWGQEYSEFYDVESGLLAGSIRSQESPMGAIEVTSIVNEYGMTGKLRMPRKLTQRAMGFEQIITLAETSFEPFDDAVFELPPEIRALIK